MYNFQFQYGQYVYPLPLNYPLLTFIPQNCPVSAPLESIIQVSLPGSQQSQRPIPQEIVNKNQPESSGQPRNDRSKAKKRGSRRGLDENFGWRYQNKDRNIISNMLKSWVNHISEKKCMTKYIEFLCQRSRISNGVSMFEDLMNENFPKSKSYIRLSSVARLLRSEDYPKPLLKVLRLVLKKYFKEELYLSLLNSTKTKTKSKQEQIKKSHEILANLLAK